VELQELIRFFANPAAFFLGQRLGVRLAKGADVLADVEPFEITGLQKYGTRQTLLDLALAGHEAADAFPILRGEGRLPHGAVGRLAFEAQAAAAKDFAERVRARLPEPGEPLEVDLELGPNRLRGWLPGPRETGLVTYRFGKLRARDRIAAWIRHLALCAAYPQPSWASHHLAEDLTLHIDPVPSARSLLEDLLDIRWQGLRAPLCFFPETSLAFAEEGGLSGKVWEQWAGAYNQFRESQDPYAAIAWRDREPLASVEFAGLAERVWRPLLDRSRLGKAAEDACAA
jgi:exodeoxyribonuclease V gamma subunit